MPNVVVLNPFDCTVEAETFTYFRAAISASYGNSTSYTYLETTGSWVVYSEIAPEIVLSYCIEKGTGEETTFLAETGSVNQFVPRKRITSITQNEEDVNVKVSSNDTTTNYLSNKIFAGPNITITEANDGGDETLIISGTDPGNHTTVNEFSGSVSLVAGPNISIASGSGEIVISGTVQDTDVKVKVTSNDTTADYLFDKFVTVEGITGSQLNDGADEDFQLKLDINGLTTDTDPDGSTDYIASYDASAGTHKKILLNKLPAPAAGAYGAGIYLTSPFAWSGPVPLGVTSFETVVGMHDDTVYVSGVATGSQTSTTLQDTSKSWTVNGFTDYIVRILTGSGEGQWRSIASNTSDTLTVGTWDITPDATSGYEITNSARIVAPRDGIYAITAHCSFQFAVGAFGVAILCNGAYKSVTHLHNAVAAEITPGNTRIMQLSSSDYIEMRVWNGDSSTLLMNAGALRLYLELNRVGG